ncbi:MAG: DUF4437 domain-containing protein [Verrucomicrobiota bacterium]
MKARQIFPLVVASLVVGVVSAKVIQRAGKLEGGEDVRMRADVPWAPLNPLRGDKSPKAGALWGDRTGEGASGFLVEFVDGFSSPPHIHNVTYRGVVISGLVHNDDPEAEEMWMPAGSFWTQPAGEVHITSARGEKTVAYIEIQEGPYLVMPAAEKFDEGERPVNVDVSNIIWLGHEDTQWIDGVAGPEVAFLWGKPGEVGGAFVKLPGGFAGEIRSEGGAIRAVVIQGSPKYERDGEARDLEPGSFFGSDGQAVHRLVGEGEGVIYVRTEGAFEVGRRE